MIVSAVELLKKVSALPGRERAKFLVAVLQLEETAPLKSKKKNKHVKWPDVAARARRISGKRVLPNMVLLEREEVGLKVAL
jgi:hypothetical protein